MLLINLENFKCDLYCQSKETGMVIGMDRPVADGTRCSYDDPYSVCVDRMCLVIAHAVIQNRGIGEYPSYLRHVISA